MDIPNFIIVLITGVIGGFFNTFVGAGSLLSIPVLILLGLPPHAAIASNRLGVTGSDIAGWYGFHVKRMIDYRVALLLALPSLAGAVVGANLLLEIDERVLKKVIGGVTFMMLAVIMMNPDMGITHLRQKKKYYSALAVIAAFAVGVYGGFYGAGAGTFMFYILILFFGQTFLESAATHKLANLSFSLMAASIFAYKGMIDYSWALPLFIGSFGGSYISAYYSDRIGNIWIKRIFSAVVALLIVKLIL